MYKDINMITNKDIGFKLINSMSFGEFVFSAGFIQKTVKVDLDVRLNRTYPQRKLPQKVPEDSRGQHTEVEGEAPPGGASQPYVQVSRPLEPTSHPLCYVGSPPPPRLHLHYLFKSV
jgi:hypothetical protein